MTTTDEALTEQIARAMYEAEIEDDWLYELNEYKEPYLIFAAAVLPIIRKAERDAARASLDGLAEHIDQIASQFLGVRVGSQKAQDVRDHRDTHYPEDVTP